MSSNPIKYNSRDFNTILADINSDPLLIDKPEWFKRLIAGVGDLLSVWQNAQANNDYLRTAITRRAAQDILEPLGYNLTPQLSSSGIVLFDIDPAASLPFTLAQAEQVAIYPGSTSITSRRFEGRSDLTISASAEAVASGNWNSTTDIITVASPDFITGEKIRLTTSGGLPNPFATGVDYYVIVVSGSTIRLATSRANAYAGVYVDFLSSGTGNHTITRLSRPATLYQQTTMASFAIGSSDGITGWQEYNVSQVGIQPATVAITINGESWTKVDWLGSCGTGDKCFVTFYETDGTMTVQFGDGINYGALPGNYAIYLTGAYGGGSISNINGVGNISSYGGTNANIQGVSNPLAMTGGSDPESIATASKIAPIKIASQNRFVTTQDGEALALAYGGLATVKVNPNAYGILSAQVVGIANGGGNPSSGLRASIAAYLTSVSLLEEIYVQFDAATITPENVISAAKLLPGYTWSGIQGAVKPYFELAWKLFFSETGNQILTTYQAQGISGAVTLINTIFGSSFSSLDYAAIKKLMDLWDSGAYSPREFGETIQVSEPYGFIQSGVSGLSYMTITAPVFPVTYAADAITTIGTVTTSVI